MQPGSRERPRMTRWLGLGVVTTRKMMSARSGAVQTAARATRSAMAGALAAVDLDLTDDLGPLGLVLLFADQSLLFERAELLEPLLDRLRGLAGRLGSRDGPAASCVDVVQQRDLVKQRDALLAAGAVRVDSAALEGPLAQVGVGRRALQRREGLPIGALCLGESSSAPRGTADRRALPRRELVQPPPSVRWPSSSRRGLPRSSRR